VQGRRAIARILISAGGLLLAGVLAFGFTSAAYSWTTTGQLHVVKTDAIGTPLVGAGFTLYTVAKDGTPGAATAWSCLISRLDGGVADCTTSDQVTPGAYWVVETTVPAGYSAGAPQKVTIAKLLVTTVTFKDDLLSGSVVIAKTTSGGQPLAGAGFMLYTDTNDSPGTSTGKSCSETAVVGGVASCSIAPVSAGTFWVKEVTVPSGYLADSPRQVTVSPGHVTAITFVDVPLPITTTTTASPPSTTTTTTAQPPSTTTTTTRPPSGTTTTTTPPPSGSTTTTMRPPTGPGGGTTTTVVQQKGSSTTTRPVALPVTGGATPVSGVSTVHTGLPFAGSKNLVILLGSIGMAMILGGALLGRRTTSGPTPEETAP